MLSKNKKVGIVWLLIAAQMGCYKSKKKTSEEDIFTQEFLIQNENCKTVKGDAPQFHLRGNEIACEESIWITLSPGMEKRVSMPGILTKQYYAKNTLGKYALHNQDGCSGYILEPEGTVLGPSSVSEEDIEHAKDVSLDKEVGQFKLFTPEKQVKFTCKMHNHICGCSKVR